MINLNETIISQPYPILIQENFFDAELYKDLLKTFPHTSKFGKAFRMHGELTFPDYNYRKLLKNKSWNKLHNYIYSNQFVDKMLNYFSDEIKLQKDILINVDDFEYKLEYEGRKINKNYQINNVDKYLHTRMDIGYGIENYGQIGGGGGIHIDNYSRLFSILVYFCDTSDFENGEFQVHDANNNFNIVNKIKPKHNLAVISIQNNEAYHSVNPVKKCKKPRYSLYISIYCKQNLWKKIDDNYLATMSKNR